MKFRSLKRLSTFLLFILICGCIATQTLLAQRNIIQKITKKDKQKTLKTKTEKNKFINRYDKLYWQLNYTWQDDLGQQKWDKLDSILSKIDQKAAADNDSIQALRAFMARCSIRFTRENHKKNFEAIESRIKVSKPIERSVLQLFLAMLYKKRSTQITQNQSTMMALQAGAADNTDTWPAQEFDRQAQIRAFEAVNSHFSLLYLQDAQKYLGLDAGNEFFDIVFSKTNQTAKTAKESNEQKPVIPNIERAALFPTLADLMIVQAAPILLDFQPNFANPKIDKPDLLTDSVMINALLDTVSIARFANLKPDSLAGNAQKYLLLIAQLEKSHISQKNESGLLKTILNRISLAEFISESIELYYQKIKINSSDQTEKNLEFKAKIELLLTHSLSRFSKKTSGYSEIEYALAELFREKNQFAQAIKLYRNIVARQDYVSGFAHTMIDQLSFSGLQISISDKVLPNKPVYAVLHSRNIAKIYVHVWRINKQMVQRDSIVLKIHQIIETQKPMAEYSYNRVINQGSVASKSLGILLGAMPIGAYLIMASENQNLKNPGQKHLRIIEVKDFKIMAIYLSNQAAFRILNAKTGQALKPKKVWADVYEMNTQSEQVLLKTVSLSSNADGLITDASNSFAKPIQYHSKIWKLFFIIDKDTLKHEQTINYQPEQIFDIQKPRPVLRHYMYTDRALYKTNETIALAGVVFSEFKNKRKAIAKGSQIYISLTDPNGEPVGSATAVLNANGSYSAKIQIPIGRLDGQWSIMARLESRLPNHDEQQGYASIRVEAFKKPKLEIVLSEPRPKNIKIWGQNRISGNVQSINGIPLQQTQVKISFVGQKPSIFYKSEIIGYNYRNYINQENAVLFSSQTKTDLRGNFEFIIEGEVLKLSKYLYGLEMKIEAIAPDGESQQISENLGLLAADFDFVPIVAQNYHPDSVKIIGWKANDQYGNKPKAKLFWQIFKQTKANLIANTGYYEPADSLIGNITDFQTYYPFDLTNKSPVYQLVGQSNNNLQTDTAIKNVILATMLNNSGSYKIVFKAVGISHPMDTLVTVSDFEILNLQPGNTPQTNRLFSIIKSQNKIVLDPNTKGVVRIPEILVSSAANSLWVYAEVRQNNEFLLRKYVQINKGISRIDLPIIVGPGTAVQIVLSGVYENINFNTFVTIPVAVQKPVIKTIPLKIVPVLVSDKMLPASAQEWRFQLVKGTNPITPIVGQAIATMYDAATDKIIPHNWNVWNPAQPNEPETESDELIQNRYGYQPQWNWFLLENNLYMLNWYGTNYNSDFSNAKWLSFLEKQRAGILFKKDYFDYKPDNYQNSYIRSPRASRKKTQSRDKDEDRMELMVESASISEAAATAPNPSPMAVTAKMQADKPDNERVPSITMRKNLRDLAFFYPEITTDANGIITVAFSAPEALSRWRMMMLAYDQNFEPAYLELSRPTQKLLMSQPHLPRYFRESDTLRLTSLIKNISEEMIVGRAMLELLDAQTLLPISHQNGTPIAFEQLPFSIEKNGQFLANWTVIVPKTNLKAMVCRISAFNKDFSDGEENVLAVLSDARLITKALAMQLYKKGKYEFGFDALLESKPSSSQSLRYSLEAMPNPIWTVVEALPYLVNDESRSASAIAYRLYANQIAYAITQKQPEILKVIGQWSKTGSDALISNLEKNPELKQVLISQTPWLTSAKTETQNKKQIVSLLDTKKLESDLDYNLAQLKSLQNPDGGFVWWPTMPSNAALTVNIMALLGRLNHIEYTKTQLPNQLKNNMEQAAIMFLDRQISIRYLQDISTIKPIKKRVLDMQMLELLYARSLYLNIEFKTMQVFFNGKTQTVVAAKAYTYFLKLLNKTVSKQDLDAKALTALVLLLQPNKALYRPLAIQLGAQIAERAFCKQSQTGCYWNVSDSYDRISAHVRFMEVLEKTQDSRHKDVIEQAKLWLMLQKQTTYWQGTQAASDACYSLLMNAKKQLDSPEKLTIALAGKNIVGDNPAEQASGYYKKSFEAGQILPEMGRIEIQKSTDNFAWAAAYWQYIQDSEKIEASQNTQISLERQYFRLMTEGGRQVLEPLGASDPIRIGQTIRVRIVLISRQNLEFVHLKDQRAAAFEPLEQLSEYKYKNELSYYQNMQDASSDFFISYLPAGTHVFEYDLKASHSGRFSNGLASIECAYAPQMRANSAGSRIWVKE